MQNVPGVDDIWHSEIYISFVVALNCLSEFFLNVIRNNPRALTLTYFAVIVYRTMHFVRMNIEISQLIWDGDEPDAIRF